MRRRGNRRMKKGKGEGGRPREGKREKEREGGRERERGAKRDRERERLREKPRGGGTTETTEHSTYV